jgi:hypothetical protein
LASTPIETERKRGQLVGNVRSLVDKYCAIFDWDVPDIDQAAADKLILAEIRKALDTIERSLAGCDTRRSGDDLAPVAAMAPSSAGARTSWRSRRHPRSFY